MRLSRFTPPFDSLDQFLAQRTHGFLVSVLLCLVALVYVNSLDASWIFDDLPNIVDNPRLHLSSLDWTSLSGTFIGTRDDINRPLAYLSFGLNHYFHGLDVLGYHLVNVTIHALTALTLYVFLLKTLQLPMLQSRYAERAKAIAFLGALLWATSPIQVTAVTVIVQRMASMAAFFFLFSMLCYLFAQLTPDWRRRWLWLALCVLSGLLSLATKENAAMLPLAIYLYDVLLIREVDRVALKRQLKLAAIPLAVLAILTLMLIDPAKIFAGYDHRPFTLLERLLTEPRVLLLYLTQMLVPIPAIFALIHDIQVSTSLWNPWTTLPAILFWTGWLGLGLYLADKRPLIAFALIFFLINHAIESTIIPLELAYEHRNYLPSMMLYPLAAIGILWLGRTLARPAARGAVAFGVAAFLVLQGYTVMDRNAIFAHPILVWTDNLAKAPGQSRVYTNLGQVYSLMNMPEKARETYEAALAADSYHRPHLRAVPLGNLGNGYLRDRKLDKAREYYAQAVEIDPGNMKYRIGLIVSLMGLGELDAAKPVVEAGLAQLPDDPGLLSLYGTVLFKLADYPAAIAAADKTLARDPTHEYARKILGEAHLRLGEYAEAGRYWRSVADTNPNDIEANLALLKLADLNNDEAALRRAARRLQAIRQDRTWESLLGRLASIQANHGPVFIADPKGLLPLIERALADRAG
ncbi:tetratricopeptide repeat protein [Thiocystis violascens]|uniref:Tetratricopeptide repeat protein n=1 Tax=Thiocystis violascens (strain ATCC 17096 / DSM 198 / 6111) TaxID=765911 RepID=I3Y5E7_THIV6|nr:tetratricopeptide repeat protein [Thiocystis violascens]AFL72215.1 tetratricopeptide repeat protein [Thiocystis violascens DSM 198]